MRSPSRVVVDKRHWVLSTNEDHWATTPIHQAVFKHGVRYDTIVMCMSINREMVCSRICRGGKRPRSSLQMVDGSNDNDSIMQCFNFVDRIQSSLGNCEPVSSSVNSHCDSFKDCLEWADEFEQNENEYVSQTIKMASLINALTCVVQARRKHFGSGVAIGTKKTAGGLGVL